jgi:hypothetical protein
MSTLAPTSNFGYIDDCEKASLQVNVSKNRTISVSQDKLNKNTHEDLTFWMNGNSLSQSEAVCIKHRNGMNRCNTRISAKDISKKNSSGHASRPNVLLILLDPMSRSHFDRSMPKSTTTLVELDFVGFERYTAVGVSLVCPFVLCCLFVIIGN